MSGPTAAEVALRWVDLYNDGTPDSYGSDRFLELYEEDVDWREMPTQFNPEGRMGGLSALRQAVREGQAALVDRRVDLQSVISDADRAALQYTWEATVAVDGLLVPKGTRLRAAIAQFITVRSGKIAASTEYAVRLPVEGSQ